MFPALFTQNYIFHQCLATTDLPGQKRVLEKLVHDMSTGYLCSSWQRTLPPHRLESVQTET